MEPIRVKVHGLDCAEEVAILKRALRPLIQNEEQLAFDLLNARLSVRIPPTPENTTAVIDAVRKAGMRAVLWEQHVARAEEAAGFWQTHGRTLMCSLSGASLLGAILIHASVAGWWAALSAHEAEAYDYPLPSAVLYLASILTGAWFFAPKAWHALRTLRPDINLLVVIAASGAVLLGNWTEGALVAFLFSVALLLESWSVGRARRAIAALLDLAPATARFRSACGSCVHEKPVEEVPVNATVLLRPGERVPLDGQISLGATSMNQAPITGESAPVNKSVGDEVYAGTINNEGAIEFTVTRPAEDSSLARIIRMVEEAQARRAPSEQWVDRFALYYTPTMMGVALLVFLVPPLLLGAAWAESFYSALVLLLIACPCALVISTPVSIIAGLTSAARAGVLIKGGAYLEMPARLKVLALDKTGTLTLGEPRVQQVVPLNGHGPDELLGMAASIEQFSKHPLAQAIVRHADEQAVARPDASEFQDIPGKGAHALLGTERFWIGSHRLLAEMGCSSETATETALSLEDAGHSVVLLGSEGPCAVDGGQAGHVCGLISIADAVREDSRATITALREAGIAHIVMLTGDNEGTARDLAARVGIEEYRAGLLPEDKVAAIKELKQRYGAVGMIGDGINDAPAMASADLAIAMGAVGSDAAIETADIALMSDDLSRIPWLVQHSKRTMRVIKQNIALALGLKLVVLVLAFFGLATLWLAVLADMGASLIVISNGLRLLRA